MKKLLLLLVLASFAASTYGQVNVLTHRYDGLRTNQNLNESALNTSNVTSATFGRLYTFAVDGTVYAQPLYVSNLTIPGKGSHNVVFVVTEHDSVYAFDADTATTIWHTSFINPSVGITTVPIGDLHTSDLIPDTEVGIMSTPVIDLAGGTIYLVASTKENGAHFYRLHALDITTGVDKVPPVAIQGSVPGNGQGSISGTLTFNPAWQLQRPGLALVNGNVYAGFGSTSDNFQWHGWLFGYNGTTLGQVAVFCATPNDIGGGIWAAGEAPAIDPSGNLYFSTGNGALDGSTNFGDAFVKLGTANGLTVLDFFSPFNQQALNAADLDIASAGILLLPDSAGTAAHPHIAIGSGKAGAIYVLDRDQLGGFNGSYTNPDSQIIQEIWNALGIISINTKASALPYVENNYSTPAFWQNHLYWTGINDTVKMFNIANGLLSTAPVSHSATAYGFGGAQPVISASSPTATSAILWTVERASTNILHAYDATNLATEIYNSNQAPGNRDLMGPSVKFVVPTVANGKVFVGSQTQIDVFGLLGSTPAQTPAPTFSPLAGGYINTQNVSILDANPSAVIYYTLDGSVPTTLSTQFTGPIPVSATTTVTAVAVAGGLLTSPIATATYKIGGTLVTTGGFVQGNYATPQSPQSSVSVPFLAAQTSGDLNLVVVGWNDSTATVNSVKDTVGNIYNVAVGPTVQAGSASQTIYYAKNIAPAALGANAVTVTFNGAARFPDIRIAEYAGLDTNNPLDAMAGATGNSTLSDSGPATTTSAIELIVGANITHANTISPGGNFVNRMITSPDGDILEDMVVTSTGTYNASASTNPAGGWVMQMATFKAASSTPTPTAPSNLTATAASSGEIDLVWSVATETGGTISQYLVERCQGTTCSNFAQVGTSTLPSFSDTTGLTPLAAYTYRVRAMDTTNNLGPYSIAATATTLSVNAPTAPTNLAAAAVSSTQVNLTWTASTPATGTIGNYLIERCTGNRCIINYVQVGTSTTTAFSDTGLLPSTTYTYRVRAVDSSNNFSAYSSYATATTADSTVAAPSNLTATATSSTQINLSWTASSGTISQYLIERCLGVNCGNTPSNFAQVGTSATTSYNDSGLTASTSYSYRVRATDGTNFSGYSNTTSATTAAPTFTAPSNLAASAASNTQINLAWTAATETGGTISQYLVERCAGAACSNFTQVNTSTTTTFNDTGLTPATSYSYRVRATDAASNLGPYSNVASATTLSAPPPPAVSFIQVNSADPQTPQTTVAVPYTAAQRVGDLNVVVVGWNDSTATVNTVSDTKGNTYTLAVGPTVQGGTASQSIYYAKNIVAAAAGANSVTVKFNGSAAFPDIRILEYSGLDTVNPLDVTAAAMGNSATSNSGAATTTNANDLLVGANVVQTGTTGAGPGFTTRVITNPDADIAEDQVVSAVGSYGATAPVSPSGLWIMQMVAFKAAGSTPTPSAPTSLAATVVGPVEIDMSWTASTEAGGTIATYLIERCAGAACSSFTQVATTTSPTTTYNDATLLGSTSYSYRVRAKDSAGSTGPYSNTTSATTAAPTFTAPSGLSATASSPVQVNLSWTAGTETGGTITNYLIERCSGATCSNFVQVGTSSTVAYTDNGLLGSTTYSYRVRATDGTNFSGYSNTNSATTAAPTFTAPASLTATAASNTQINLSWTAATETGGTISQYLIERCAGAACSNVTQVNTSTTTTFNDTGLTPSTSYSYRVRATDGTNSSGYSNTTSATTAAPALAAPSNLTATAASSTQINLSWTNNASNQTGFKVERSPDNVTFTQIATTGAAGISFSDSSLAPLTTYYYRVRATNSAGDSGYSNVANATTPTDTTPPTAPTNLTATAASSTQINLSWTASTDNVGVKQYQIQRCQGAACNAFALAGTSATPNYADTGLLAATSYSYQVRALDAAGNASAFSNISTTVTQSTAPPPPVTLVQHTETSVSSGTNTISQSFHAASVSGDLILVTVKWGNQGLSVSSVADNKGNVYTTALGPTNWAGTLKAAQTFYAKNITGGGAPITITVTLTGNSASSFHIYQFEYANIDPTNPIDTACASAGVGTTSSCGPVTTSSANELLYAVTFSDRGVTNAGTGFTTLSTAYSNLVESVQTAAAGSYMGTASNTLSTSWFMHLLAIKRHP